MGYTSTLKGYSRGTEQGYTFRGWAGVQVWGTPPAAETGVDPMTVHAADPVFVDLEDIVPEPDRCDVPDECSMHRAEAWL